MRMNKGQPFLDVEADSAPSDYTGDGCPPTFSETFLYDAVGKGDARFILGVAEEYDHVISALGPAAVTAILDVSPRLVQRLGTGVKVTEWLADARSVGSAEFNHWFPPQVILDKDAAEVIWTTLHAEYRRYFDPESAMNKDALRAYNVLTDALGSHEQEQRRKEQERRPEKLKAQRAKQVQFDAERARRRAEPTEVDRRVAEALGCEPEAVRDARNLMPLLSEARAAAKTEEATA